MEKGDLGVLGIIVGFVALLIGLVVWGGSADGKVRVIGGCEYIQSEGYYSRSLVHKANCTNAIHQGKGN